MTRQLSAFFCALALAGCSRTAVPLAPSPVAVGLDTAGRSHEDGSSSYRLLHSFAGSPSDGAQPDARLLLVGSQLYGTTASGGKSQAGAVFVIALSGRERLLYSFPSSGNGKNPKSGLTRLGSLLYGTTYRGGGTDCNRGCGTVYRVTTSGGEGVLYAFTGSTDGASPLGGVTVLKGLMYGTTLNGGCSSSSCVGSCNCGTIYTITPSGTVRQIYAFVSLGFDGGLPSTGLTYLNGGLYGTTRYTIFKIRPSGRFYVLHRFHGGADGAQPEGDLLAFNGALYGTTFAGGTGCAGNGCGVVFKLSTSGSERILYRFKGGADGRNPSAGLIAFNNQLYGTTSAGGSCNGNPSGCGTIFAVNPSSGAERVLYRFKGGTDGEQPGRGRLIAVNATLYGTTAKGGMKHSGTVFSFVP